MKASVEDFVTSFEKFSRKDQLEIAHLINKKTFLAQWKELDAFLPDVNMSESEIMKEIKQVRSASQKDHS